MLYLDLETYSECNLKQSGAARYAEDLTTEVMLWAYAWDDQPVQVWDRTVSSIMPSDLREWLDSDAPVAIHNSFFDRTVLREVLGIDIPCERIHDTMVQALAHGLPGSLGMLSLIFGMGEDKAKMKEGRSLVLQFCKPFRGKRDTRLTHPERWELFKEYAKHDIEAMRELRRLLPTWNYPGQPGHALWCLDQKINDRGFLCDLELAEAAVEAANTERQTLNEATQEATGGEVEAATQRDALLEFILSEYGVSLPDMRQDTLQRRVNDPNLPLALRELLELRIQSSRNSSAKYLAAMRAVSYDGRLRGGLQYRGAATTGRWSGRLFQPQNMMRPTITDYTVIEEGIEDIKAGVAPLLYSNLPELLGNAARGVIIAPEDKRLVCSDLSAIEGRGLAWIADDERIVQFYRDFDAGLVEYDSYMLAYTLVAGGAPEDVTKAQRTIGKPVELAFGYGGGVAAFLTFAMTYHLDLDDLADKIWSLADGPTIEMCADKYEWAKENGYHGGMNRLKYAAFEYAKQKWRASRQPTVRLWNELADAFKGCVQREKQTYTLAGGKLKMRRDGSWLRLRLPSGRNLCFLKPQVKGGELSYMGMDNYTHKWQRTPTHGGKLSGIVTQAFACDVLAYNMPEVERQGFEIVLSVHDELITETLDGTAEELNALMSRQPPWAADLPLKANGFETHRYRKD